MKNLDDIWQEFIDQDALSTQTINDLIWHIENDERPGAISMATDMIVRNPTGILLKKLISHLAKQLDNEDDFKREFAVNSVVGRLKLSEYASKALDMAKNDPYDNVRGLASSHLGAVINKVDPNLRKQIAAYLYDAITNAIYDDWHKQCVYDAILEAMEVPIDTWPAIKSNPDISSMVDKNLLEKFKIKFNIGNEK